MTNLPVNIVELPHMRCASFYHFGEEPEMNAWRKLENWVKENPRYQDLSSRTIMGFNNPNPCCEGATYGYEFLLEIDKEVIPEGDMRIVDFYGGLYAVARCEPKGDPSMIMKTWMGLMEWVDQSDYSHATHQWMEKHLGGSDMDTLVLDIHLPIMK